MRRAEEPPASGSAGERRTPLRIAAHTGAGGWAGAGLGITRLLTGLDRRGHAVRLYSHDRDVKARATAAGILTRRQPLGPLALHHAFRFAAELRLRRPDVLLLTTPRTVRLGALAARRAGIPRVVVSLALETDMPRARKGRPWSGRVDAVVLPTEAMRRRFLEAVPAFTGDAVAIHPGVAPPVVRGGPALRAMLGVPLSAPLIGTAGPLVERKRLDRLVQLVAGLPAVHCLVAGDGPVARRLDRLAARFGVADRLHRPGFLDDLGPALDAMDVFVITSEAEGLSRAMLEAMAAGVPVVSTPVSGAAEALDAAPARDRHSTDPGPGLTDAGPQAGPDPSRHPAPSIDLVPDGPDPPGHPASSGPASSRDPALSGDLSTSPSPGLLAEPEPESLIAAVGGLLSDRGRLRSMGAAGRAVARERFGETRMLAEWEPVLCGTDAAG